MIALRTAVLVLVAALAPALVEAAPAAKPPPIITQPDWLKKPNGEDLARAYPDLAQRLSLEGEATTQCMIDELGRLVGCRAIKEQPAGFGFGDAAVALTPLFQMRPMTVNGQAVAGAQVRIPLRFQLPRDPLPPKPVPSSSEGLAAARKLIADMHATDGVARSADREALEIDTVGLGGASERVAAEIAKDLRAAVPTVQAQLLDELSRLYASRLTVADLQALDSFVASPVGQAMVTDSEDRRAMETMTAREFRRRQIADSQAIFCSAHDCTPQDRTLGLLADASGPKPRVGVAAPVWSQTPSDEEIAQELPQLARLLGLGAVVRFTCTASSNGALEDCALAGEAPKGLGFGVAARALISGYRLAPQLLAQGVGGERVALLIEFPGSDEAAEPFTGVPARSAAALELARAVLRAQGGATPPLPDVTDTARQLAAEPTFGVTFEEAKVALGAVAQGSTQAWQTALDQQAAYSTVEFSDTQLRSALAFWTGPTSANFRAGYGALLAEGRMVAEMSLSALWAEAGRLYCQAHDCGHGAPQPPSGSSPAASTTKP